MLRKRLFFYVIVNVLSLTSLFAQQTEKFDYEFLGVLLLSKSDLYSYKLEFNVYKDSIKGYSYTDLSGENETKSYIYGTFDKNTNEFSFQEKDVLYTKSDVVTDEFCFIKSRGILKLKSKKNSFEADFEGVYPDGEVCANGKIKIVGTKFIQKKLKKIYKKVKNKKRIDSVVKEKVKPERLLAKFGRTTITDKEKINIYLKNSKAKFEIWDYGKEDGDIVDVYINEKKVLANLMVKKAKKTLYLNLKEGVNAIKITTVSSGSIQSNTAKVKIYDASRFYELTSNIRKGESAEINIILKK